MHGSKSVWAHQELDEFVVVNATVAINVAVRQQLVQDMLVNRQMELSRKGSASMKQER